MGEFCPPLIGAADVRPICQVATEMLASSSLSIAYYFARGKQAEYILNDSREI